MTKRNSADVAFFLINGLNVVGALTQFDDKSDAGVEDITALGDTWQTNLYTGMRNTEMTQEGFYDDVAGGWHQALMLGMNMSSTNPPATAAPGATTPRIVSYSLEGTATGARFIGWEDAVEMTWERQVSRGALTKAKATYRTGGTVDEGKILIPWKVVSSTFLDTPVLDWGAAYAASTTGAVFYLHHQTSSLTTANGEAEFFIRHSSDNITFNALFNFACSTGPNTAQRVVTTGYVERYVAPGYSTGTVSGSTGILAFIGMSRDRTSGA